VTCLAALAHPECRVALLRVAGEASCGTGYLLPVGEAVVVAGPPLCAASQERPLYCSRPWELPPK
jgi:hypothetical protein